MRHLILLLFISIALPAYSQNTASNEQKAISVLQKVADKLNGLTSFSYNIKRELNYASENYHNISEWSCYFTFDNSDEIVGFKYQINTPASTNFFNGTEKFELNKENKTIQINNNPQKNDFKNLSYLYNSIITLKNVLPLIIAGQSSTKTLADTIINNHLFESITINLGKRRIQNLGEGFDSMKTKYDFIYKIIIDKISNMPIEVLQKDDLNDDFIKTSFTNINITPNQPTENSWYYSAYTDEYKPARQKEILQLISVGSVAPDWTLPRYNKNEKVSLSGLKGKVILLDFWFKNCSPCIESVPHLNAIDAKFKNKKFELLGINTWDLKKDIAWFCNKHKVGYDILMNGRELADRYGIDAFPTMILIDKEGKVLYSGGFDQSRIEKLIEKAL
ncbi:MAG: TlpA disulfide reductase family protein [Agriterribacter sp.]